MVHRFDEIAINSTAKKKPEESDRFCYIGLEHIEPGTFEISHWGADAAPVGEKLIMRKGDILFGKRRAYQRKVAIAPFDGIFSAHGMVLRPKEEVICKEYFPFFLSSDQFMDTAIRISVGGLSPTINWKDLQQQEFDLPSLEEQRRLADKLWAAYELKEAYKKMIAATDEMVKAQFIEMFFHDDIMLQKLHEHINITRGVSYKPDDVIQSIDSNASIILRANNIDCGDINYEDLVYVKSYRVSDEQLLSPGDIVMCASNGSKNLVGKAAILHFLPNIRTSFGAFCLGIRCKSTILPEYLSTYFQTSLYRDKIESLGAGSNIINIKPAQIYDLEIPVPPIENQHVFCNIVNQAEKSKSELRQAIEKIDRVMKSLMQ